MMKKKIDATGGHWQTRGVMAVIKSKSPRLFCRPGPVIKRAVGRFCIDKNRSESEVAKMALEQFLPRKYLVEARRKLNGKRKAAR